MSVVLEFVNVRSRRRRKRIDPELRVNAVGFRHRHDQLIVVRNTDRCIHMRMVLDAPEHAFVDFRRSN